MDFLTLSRTGAGERRQPCPDRRVHLRVGQARGDHSAAATPAPIASGTVRIARGRKSVHQFGVAAVKPPETRGPSSGPCGRLWAARCFGVSAGARGRRRACLLASDAAIAGFDGLRGASSQPALGRVRALPSCSSENGRMSFEHGARGSELVATCDLVLAVAMNSPVPSVRRLLDPTSA